MAHRTAKDAYKQLEERLNRFPQGAPPSETLYKILEMLFSQREAHLVAQLPIKPFTVKTAARIWGLSLLQTEKVLTELASRAILLDLEVKGCQRYMLPPPMAGFIEFSMMRTRGDLDQKLLGELYYQYLNVEEDFVKDLFIGTETRLGRAFVQESVLTNEQAAHVLDFERATQVVESASHIGISMCYCRHKMMHVGKACDAPMDICMTFGGTAKSLIDNGYARQVDAVECKELLHKAYEANLVQFGENVREDVSFICNCCGCCCEALVAVQQFAYLNPVVTTRFLPEVKTTCNGCGRCETACPIQAISIEADVSGDKRAVVDEALCIGCAVCVRNCGRESLGLKEREKKILTPANTAHRSVLMAIEKGMLVDLICDNQALLSHRAMAAVLSAIVKLSPVKRALASQQMKSVYLDRLLRQK